MELSSLFVFLLACLVIGIDSSKNPAITCRAGNFTAEEAGFVTCFFGPDILDDRYHIEVIQYPYDVGDSYSGDPVLQCYRLEEGLQCSTDAGFQFDNQIQANLTITIPKVTPDHAGRYSCQLIPPEGRETRLCDLHVQGTVSKIRAAEEVNYGKVLALAVFFGVLSLLFGVIIIYLLVRKNQRKLKEFFRYRQRRKADVFTNTRYHCLPLRKRKFPGDEEDTKKNSKRPYQVDIDLNYEVEDKRKFEDSEGYKRKYNDDSEERVTPYTVDIDLDYRVADKSYSVEREGYKRKYDRHDAEREAGYEVNISLDYQVEGIDEIDEGYKPRRYDGDSEDVKRKPLKFTIPPQQWGDVQITETQPDAQPPRPVVHRDFIRSPTRRL